MVASVGPYTFSTIELGAASCHAAAEVAGSGSPQNKLRRRLGSAPDFSSLMRCMKPIREGTENHVVSSCCLMNRVGAITT